MATIIKDIQQLHSLASDNSVIITISEDDIRNRKTSIKYNCECGKTCSTELGRILKSKSMKCRSCARKGKKYKTHKNYEEVKKIFEDEGCTLLSTEYSGAKEPLEYICSNGHTSTTTFNRFNQGHRCMQCLRGSKISYDTIKQRFKDYGVKLITTKDEYNIICNTVNGIKTEPLSFYCKSCGCLIKSLWYNICKDVWTGICIKCNHDKYRYDPQMIYDYMEERGCELLTPLEEYSSVNQLLGFLCYCGGIGVVSFKDFKHGKRCSNCIGDRRRATCLKKYNVDNPSKDPEIQRKIRETTYERHGVYHIMHDPERVKQAQATNIKRYNAKYKMCTEEVLQKGRKTNIKNLGVEYPLKSETIQKKVEATNKEKLEVRRPLLSPFIHKKINETCQTRYGADYFGLSNNMKILMLQKYNVPYYLSSKEAKQRRQEFQEKSEQVCLEKYGAKYYVKSEKYKQEMIEKYGVEYYVKSEKCKQEMIEKYGAEYYMQSKEAKQRREEFQEKSRQTSLDRYGVPYPMQNPDILEKAVRNAFKRKLFTFPSGREEYIQGYEHFCIQELLDKEGYSEDEIFVSCKNVPRVPYISPKDGKQHYYFPDIFIPKGTERKRDMVVEVKSLYVYNLDKENNLAKWTATHELGYNMRIMMYDYKGRRIDDILYMWFGTNN